MGRFGIVSVVDCAVEEGGSRYVLDTSSLTASVGEIEAEERVRDGCCSCTEGCSRVVLLALPLVRDQSYVPSLRAPVYKPSIPKTTRSKGALTCIFYI